MANLGGNNSTAAAAASVRGRVYCRAMVDTLKRKLTFSAWADGVQKEHFNPVAAAESLVGIDEDEQVHEHGESLTAVEVINDGSGGDPVMLRLLALHDADNAPSSWGPGAGASEVDFGDGRYSAFFAHVVIWDDKVLAHDAHPNAPGLGRLAEYIRSMTDQRVLFRALYEQGLADQLSDLEGVRSVEYGIYRPSKLQNARAEGLFGSLLPDRDAVPSFRVSLGMGRKSKRDAYLPPDLADEVVQLTDRAEQLFDSLVISGKSKTRKTSAGNPQTVSVNLLSQRLHVVADLPRDPDNRSAVEESAAFDALVNARAELDADDKITDAEEARVLLDQQS